MRSAFVGDAVPVVRDGSQEIVMDDKKMQKRKRIIRHELTKFLFVVPVLCFFSFSILIPFLSGIEISFTNWDGFSAEKDFVGLKNYINFFTNPSVLRPIKNTVIYTILTTVLGNLTSLLFALGINRNFKGRAFCRMAFFLPTAISMVLASFIWKYIFRDLFSQMFGIKNLLGQTSTVLLGLTLIHMWIDVGINMLVYLSSLQTIPKELLESAEIDGAGYWKRFFKVTLPMIVPAFTTCITLSITFGLKEFALPFTATQGGPMDASVTIGMYIYNNLMSYKIAGYGQAVAIIFAVAIVLISGFVSGTLRKKEVEF